MSFSLMQFGPWAVITGASAGIGKEYALQLAKKGFNLVIVARRLELLQEQAAYLTEQYGIRCLPIELDLSRPNAQNSIIEQTAHLNIGLLISNAGFGRPGRFNERSSEDLNEILHLNALSHVWLAQHFVKIFLNRGKGGILFTGAMGATNGVPFMAFEAGTKSFIEGLGKSINWELREKNIHVTTVVTPPTETPVLEKLGFTKENMPSKPISTELYVRESLIALANNKPSVIPGRKYRIMNALLPNGLSRQLMGKMMQKNNSIK